VIVPQIVSNPSSIKMMFRWRSPLAEDIAMRSRLSDAAYLKLVFDDSGAQVYEFLRN
jgi:hypothetical protein